MIRGTVARLLDYRLNSDHRGVFRWNGSEYFEGGCVRVGVEGGNDIFFQLQFSFQHLVRKVIEFGFKSHGLEGHLEEWEDFLQIFDGVINFVQG